MGPVAGVIRAVLLSCASGIACTPTTAYPWSSPALTIGKDAGADGMPVLLVDGGSPQPAYWLTLHTFYTNVSLFEYQIQRAAQAGLRVHLPDSGCAPLLGPHRPLA